MTWLMEAVNERVDPKNVTIVTGAGSHKQDTPADVARMFGENIATKYAVVSHDSKNPATMREVGKRPNSGKPVYMNEEYADADVKIAVGYVEPHFMAGFSGGYKAIVPGIADIGTIIEYHSVLQILQKPDVAAEFLASLNAASDEDVTAFWLGLR